MAAVFQAAPPDPLPRISVFRLAVAATLTGRRRKRADPFSLGLNMLET